LRTQCSACNPGTYDPGNRICQPCPAGHFQPYFAQHGVGTCQKCLAGKYTAQSGSFECALCEAGFHQPLTGAQTCQPCQAGMYTSLRGRASCDPCDNGKVQPNSKSTGCDTCNPGFFAEFKTLPCQACPRGKYQSQTQRTHCDNCVTGKYSDTRSSECKSCEEGTYMNENFTTSITETIACFGCTPCARGTGQLARCWHNTTSPGVCTICEAGKKLVVQTGVCEPCPANQYSEYNATRNDQTTCTPCPALSSEPVAGQLQFSGDKLVVVPLSNSMKRLQV